MLLARRCDRDCGFALGTAVLHVLLFALALSLGAVELIEAAAQESEALSSGAEEEQSRPRSTDARRVEVSPRSGPPGAEITVRASSLPALTPVHIALGGTQAGFEALEFVLTSEEGSLVETVKVPDWPSPDGIHRFIIFDAYFAPLAASPLFHVTNGSGIIRRKGRIVSPGPTCAVLLGAYDELYSIVGEHPRLEVGDTVTVEGTVVEPEECTEGTVVEPVRIQVNRPNSR